MAKAGAATIYVEVVSGGFGPNRWPKWNKNKNATIKPKTVVLLFVNG